MRPSSRHHLARILLAVQCLLAFAGPAAASMDQSLHAGPQVQDAVHAAEASAGHSEQDGDHLDGGVHCCHLSAHMLGLPAISSSQTAAQTTSVTARRLHRHSDPPPHRLIKPPIA